MYSHDGILLLNKSLDQKELIVAKFYKVIFLLLENFIPIYLLIIKLDIKYFVITCKIVVQI